MFVASDPFASVVHPCRMEDRAAEHDGGFAAELHTGGFVDVCLGHFKVVQPVTAWLLETVAADKPID
ncbi:MAG: hypothetical protein GY798_07865 [Hyphomicrobiales bacterium]|nr:hypothetical protein [Hyphomicrobiales bacterium]